jgi:hypothetical protein
MKPNHISAFVIFLIVIFLIQSVVHTEFYSPQWTAKFIKDPTLTELTSYSVAQISDSFEDYSIMDIREIAYATYGDKVPNQWRVFPIYSDPNEAIKFHLAYERTFEAKDYYPSLPPLHRFRIYGDLINYPRSRVWRKGAHEIRKGSLYEDLQFKIKAHWGTDNPEGDLNMDGICDVNDYVILVQWWHWWEKTGKDRLEKTVIRLGGTIPQPTLETEAPSVAE